MTPADERIIQLLAKWRTSLDLHSRYTRLSDDQYWLVQPWPQHQRPTPWIVDLASQRLMDLQRIVQARISAGDPSLSEALELMSFLANLVGSQHVQRYIPMAEPEQQRPIESLLTQAEAPQQAPMPQAEPAAPKAPPAPAATAPGEDPGAEAAASESSGDENADVIRDAIRLLGWGRDWHELPSAISRMSGRPAATRVRQILKANRAHIEKQASQRSPRH
jgi:hypothetical protein